MRDADFGSLVGRFFSLDSPDVSTVKLSCLSEARFLFFGISSAPPLRSGYRQEGLQAMPPSFYSTYI